MCILYPRNERQKTVENVMYSSLLLYHVRNGVIKVLFNVYQMKGI